ncbi:MAG: AAA family ATPase [Myxococcota bacterium]
MRRIQFLEFEIDLDLRTLTRSERLLPIGRRCLDLLIFLIQNRQRYVSLELLRESVWGGVRLSPAAIPTCVRELRMVLGDTAIAPRIIESKRSCGYRFIPVCVYSRPDLIGLSRSDELPFVGRESELSVMRVGLRRLGKTGRTQCILLRGEAGIGKTRLVEEFLRQVPDGLRRVLFRCHSFLSDPFVLWERFLEQVVALKPSLRTRAAVSIAERVDVHGALGEMKRREIPRSKFYSIWADYLRDLVAEDPLILGFEDIHLADPETLHWIAWIVELSAELPILVILTQRPRESGFDVRKLIGEILTLPNVLLLDVGALGLADVEQLVSSLISSSTISAESMRSSTGGNPFLIGHGIAALRADLEGCVDRVGREMSRKSDLVARLTSDLPEVTRQLLSIGALVGHPFSSELVGIVGDVGCSGAVQFLEEARRARLLIENGNKYEFVHAMFRDAVGAIVEPGVRRGIHAKIAQALLDQGSLSSVAIPIAFHLIAGGPAADRVEAQRFAEIATKVAVDIQSYDDAKRFAESALALCLGMPTSSCLKQCELMLALAKCHRLLGARREAREIVLDAAGMARRESLDEVLIQCALSLSDEFSTIDVGVHDGIAEDLLREALRLCPDENVVMKAIVIARLSLSLRWSDRAEEQLSLAARACEIARKSECRVALHSGLSSLIECHSGVGQADVRKALLEEVESLGLSHLDPSEVLLHHVRKISALLEMGEVDRIAVENEAYRELATRAGRPHHIWYAETTDVMRSMLAGDLVFPDSLESYYRAVLEVSEDPNVIQGYAAQSFFREVECCRQAGVLGPLRSIAMRFPLVSGWRAAEAWLHWTLGDEGECVRVLGQMTEERIVRLAQQSGAGAALAMLCEIAADIGSLQLRRLLWSQVEPILDKCATAGYGVVYFGGFLRYGGLLARSIGLSKRSIELLSLSVEGEASRGAELWRGYSLIDLALALGASPSKRSSASSVLVDAERVVRSVRSPRLLLRFEDAKATLRR